MENDRQFIHQRNIDVALGILDNLGGFRHLDRRGAMHPGFENAVINRRNDIERFRIAARNNLGYGLQPMHLIAGVNAFRAVTDPEILKILQPRKLFEQRHTFVFGHSRVDGRFINHQRIARHVFANGSRAEHERSQIRPLVAINRSRHRHHNKPAFPELFGVSSKVDLNILKPAFRNFTGRVDPLLKQRDLGFVHIKTNNIIFKGKGMRKRQPIPGLCQ